MSDGIAEEDGVKSDSEDMDEYEIKTNGSWRMPQDT